MPLKVIETKSAYTHIYKDIKLIIFYFLL